MIVAMNPKRKPTPKNMSKQGTLSPLDFFAIFVNIYVQIEKPCEITLSGTTSFDFEIVSQFVLNKLVLKCVPNSCYM